MHGNIGVQRVDGRSLARAAEEAGLQPQAKGCSEGADSATMSRSIPVEKAVDDALIALYQNGERLRPSRLPGALLLPGWEGNMS